VIPNEACAVQEGSIATQRNQHVGASGHFGARPAGKTRRRAFAVVVDEDGVDSTTPQPIREGGGQTKPLGIATPNEKTNTHCADYYTNTNTRCWTQHAIGDLGQEADPGASDAPYCCIS